MNLLPHTLATRLEAAPATLQVIQKRQKEIIRALRALEVVSSWDRFRPTSYARPKALKR